MSFQIFEGVENYKFRINVICNFFHLLLLLGEVVNVSVDVVCGLRVIEQV